MRRVLLATSLLVVAGVVVWWCLRGEASAPRTSERGPASTGIAGAPQQSQLESAPAPARRAAGGGASLVLRPVDPHGCALPKTLVHLHTVDGTPDDQATILVAPTDADGELRVAVHPGIELRVSVDPRLDREGNVALRFDEHALPPLKAGEERVVALVLVAGCDLMWRERFVADESGAPIAGMELWTIELDAASECSSWRAGRVLARTDANGVVELCRWLRGSNDLLMEAPGRSMVVVSESATLVGADYRVSGSANIALRVVGPEGWKAPSLRARVHTPREQLYQGLHVGFASFDGPDPPRSDRFEGLAWCADVSAAGLASVEGLPARARLTLELVSGAALVHTREAPLILEPGETRAVEVFLAPDTAVTVTVLDQDSRPVAGAVAGLMRDGVESRPGDTRVVLPSNDEPRFRERARTDNRGRAHFEHVGAGAWWVALPPTRAPWDAADPRALVPCAERIELAPGELVREVVLRVERGLYVLGRVETPDGKLFPPDADKDTTPNVILIAHAVEIGGGLTGQPELDGSFALGPVTDGEFVIETSSRGYAPIEPVRVRAGGPPVVIRMQLGARIAGRIVDTATREGVRSEVVLTRVDREEAETLGSGGTDGAFAFDGLAAGEYVVGAFTQDGRSGTSARVRVAAGAPLHDVAIELAPLAQTSRVRVVVEGEVVPGRIGLWQDGACRSAQFVSGPGVFTLVSGGGAGEVRLADERSVLVRRAVVLVEGATTDVRIER